MLPLRLAFACGLCAAFTNSAAAEDLAKRYPGALTHVEQGLPTKCEPDDVWQLKSFEIAVGKDFVIGGGKAELAIGEHDGNAIWAVVFPAEPVKISAKGQPGDGETTTAICLRFQPGELGQRFPAKTVGGNGDPWLRARAQRLFQHKVGPKWSTPAGNPTIVPAGIALVDVDTSSSTRTGDASVVGRRYELDRNNAKVRYSAEFESKPVPASARIAKKEAEKIYDDVWQAFDREYANFELLPKLDWKKLGAEQRKLLARVDTNFDLAAVLADLLANLEDLHVWVKCDEDFLPGYAPDRPLNASWKGSEKLIGAFNDTQHEIVWGRSSDGIGYVSVTGLTDKELGGAFDAALEKLADTWSLVVDLRFNGGGGEDLAAAVASRFIDQERVYSKNQYRNGPKHDQLGEVLERKLAPRGPWRYESPVVVLQGRKVMSSAESLALMLAQCPQVTTMGDRTAGSSANPRRLEPGAGLTINLPRWHDMDPAGRPIEHVGIEPKIKLDFPASAFTDSADPVLEAALALLRKPVAGGHKPGKR